MASKSTRVLNLTAGTVIADNARMATSFKDRLVGLLASPPLMPGEGLVLDPCQSIHMFGMKFALDAVFYDRSFKVVGVVENLLPGRMSRLYGSARGVIELPVGTISDTNTNVGDTIEFSALPIE